MRVFALNCDKKEPFACGMLALAPYHGVGTAQDAAGAARGASAACEELGFFACEALGRIELANERKAEALIAFVRACETGYDEACARVEQLRREQ